MSGKGSDSPPEACETWVRCVDFLLWSAAHYLALTVYLQLREVWALGGGAGRSKLEGTQEGRRARGSRDRGPVSGMGVWPRATGRRAHTQPERTDKASGKLEKTFPFFPPDFL